MSGGSGGQLERRSLNVQVGESRENESIGAEKRSEYVVGRLVFVKCPSVPGVVTDGAR